MSLVVDIEKKLGSFTLRSQFETDSGTMALLGASGCGKSVTLKCIAGIMTPDKGRIVLDGETLFDSEQRIDLTPQQREIIHQVHQLLTENLDSRITIEQLSRRFLMNPSTMKELFKAEYGSSIAAHIRQHRMEKASALLLESGDSLAQVARAVGYESQSKFSAEFKKVFGMLPSEFRKLHAGH